MAGIDLVSLFESIKSQSEITEELFKRILEQNGMTDVSELDDQVFQHGVIEKVLHKSTRNYFTISSKDDFTDLEQNGTKNPFNYTMVYSPLNDHSRDKLSIGDMLFCYRSGQFANLGEALDTRGIYGVGIAASNPLQVSPGDTHDYRNYGVVVVFPMLLNKHLSVRNIQLHPETIDLTPYNGNRNDALQYINEERHSRALIQMILGENESISKELKQMYGFSESAVATPERIWKKSTVSAATAQQTSFDVYKFWSDLRDQGLIYSKEFVARFTASLMSKRFLILTGLSGSGKTQLAYNFAKWITGAYSRYTLLQTVLDSEKFQHNYEVNTNSFDLVEITNIEGHAGTKIPLPKDLIFEWFDAYENGIFNDDTNPKEDRSKLYPISKYQAWIHGFYNDLSKIAKDMQALKAAGVVKEINQYALIPVGADWTNRDPLLGYQSALSPNEYIKPDSGALDIILNAMKYPDMPFFLILDEMNLSYVERYFADFLSAMESGGSIRLHNIDNEKNGVPQEITFPDNLFIIGTVNIDETTYMFSPKVLDRANSIEFRVTKNDIEDFSTITRSSFGPIDGLGCFMADDFLTASRNTYVGNVLKLKYKPELLEFYDALQKCGAEYGFRTFNEMLVLINNLGRLDSTLTDDQKLDTAVIEKLLPKLHGSRRKVGPILIELGSLCLSDNSISVENDVLKNSTFDFSSPSVRYPLSLEKLYRMYQKLLDNGYTSFAEA